MSEMGELVPGWRDLAGAFPGGVGVTVDGEFVHVSPALAAVAGVEPAALVGEGWRSPFAPDATARIEREALGTVRGGGRWSGVVRLDDGTAVDLTLSATESGALLWLAGEPDATAGSGGDIEANGGQSEGSKAHHSSDEDRSPASPAGDGADPDHRRDLREDGPPVENVVDALDDALYVVDGDGRLVFWNAELRERFGYDPDELRELDPADFLATPDTDEVPDDPASFVDVPDRYNVTTLTTSEGEPIPHELFGTTYADEATGRHYRVGVARDISDRLERQRALERQRDELAALDRISELLLETVRELFGRTGREAVERTICERLAASALYRFAWVGERAFDGDAVVPRVTAGEGDSYLDAVTITAGEGGTADEADADAGAGGGGDDEGPEPGDPDAGPVARALRTGEVQVVDVTDLAFAPWREAARERGFESVAAVPLRDEGTVYGVLAVYADREGAFTPREQDGFDVLGRAVGSVIDAARSRELLFADAVVELEFRVDDGVLDRAAAETDCRLELEGYVPSGEEWVVYCTVDGAPPDGVAAAAATDPRIEHARTVTAAGEEGRVELLAVEASLLHAVDAAGATVRTVVADPDGADLVVEAPVDADVRELVGIVQEAFPGLDLVARRERDREVTTVGRPGGLLDDLTGRQREALEAAYRAGYFAWPRESTAEEVAASLGLAAPTLHGHLRKAQRTILSALLDD